MSTALVKVERRSLTDKEKWLCTLRWLNVLFTNHHNRDSEGRIDLEKEKNPCCGCPNRYRCPCSVRGDEEWLGEFTQEQFRVINQFTLPDDWVRHINENY